MLRSSISILTWILFAFTSPLFACNSVFDLECNIDHTVEKAARDVGQTVGKSVQDLGQAIGLGKPGSAQPLIPMREFLASKQIPPLDVGAYGIMAFRSRPTDATRSRYMMVCQSFIANFPRSQLSSVPINDQMITIWPVEDPDAEQIGQDDCDFVLKNYDLTAAATAIRDARIQHAQLDGEGPYLIGWSPSSTRGDPSKLVLIIDMSTDNSQSSIDHKFLFWKNQIVEDPAKWRHGFSFETIRLAIHDFADQYGQSMLDAIKLIGMGKS